MKNSVKNLPFIFIAQIVQSSNGAHKASLKKIIKIEIMWTIIKGHLCPRAFLNFTLNWLISYQYIILQVLPPPVVTWGKKKKKSNKITLVTHTLLITSEISNRHICVALTVHAVDITKNKMLNMVIFHFSLLMDFSPSFSLSLALSAGCGTYNRKLSNVVALV